MPQLDKYIFLHQIIAFSIFFILIYMYSRKTILPKINKILKFRKKFSKLLIFHYSKLQIWHTKTNRFYSRKTIEFIGESLTPLNKYLSWLNTNIIYKIKNVLININNIKNKKIKKNLTKNYKENLRTF